MTESESLKDVINSLLKTKEKFDICLRPPIVLRFYIASVVILNLDTGNISSYNGRETFIEQAAFRSSSVHFDFFYKEVKMRCESIPELLLELQTKLIELT
jgi:hypothetical protein